MRSRSCLLLRRGEADVAGDGLVMIGDGWMVAVLCMRSSVMCCLGVSGRVCADGGDISFSWQGGGRRTGVCLLVGLAATRQQRAQAVPCFQPSSCICWFGGTLWKVSSTLTRSFPSDILQNGEPTKVYSFKAFINTVGRYS